MILNYYTISCLLALATLLQGMPTNETNSSKDIEEHVPQKFSRNIKNKIDGAVHHIKSAGVYYTQRINKGQCFVEYDGKLLAETSLIKIRRKVFRVEECELERVYHACGPNLLLMLGVVCRFFEKDKSLNAIPNFKRQASSSILPQFDSMTDRGKGVITESCCENRCSISELTRYCHQ